MPKSRGRRSRSPSPSRSRSNGNERSRSRSISGDSSDSESSGNDSSSSVSRVAATAPPVVGRFYRVWIENASAIQGEVLVEVIYHDGWFVSCADLAALKEKSGKLSQEFKRVRAPNDPLVVLTNDQVTSCGGVFRHNAKQWIDITGAVMYISTVKGYPDYTKRLKAIRIVLGCTLEHFISPQPQKVQRKSHKPTVLTGTGDLKGKNEKARMKKRDVAWWQYGRGVHCPTSQREQFSQPEQLTQSPPKPTFSQFDFPKTSEGMMHTTW